MNECLCQKYLIQANISTAVWSACFGDQMAWTLTDWVVGLFQRGTEALQIITCIRTSRALSRTLTVSIDGSWMSALSIFSEPPQTKAQSPQQHRVVSWAQEHNIHDHWLNSTGNFMLSCLESYIQKAAVGISMYFCRHISIRRGSDQYTCASKTQTPALQRCGKVNPMVWVPLIIMTLPWWTWLYVCCKRWLY